MELKIVEVASIIVTAVAGGMFWGPWLSLTQSMRSFEPAVFLAITDRLNRNMAPIMTILLPAALGSMAPVLIISYRQQPVTFYLTLAGFALYVVVLLVTMLVEVPIVKQMVQWTVATLPPNWQQLRNRWGAFHIVRVIAAFAGLVLLVAGAICY